MSTTELIINTYEELKTFRDSVNNGTNSYQTVTLGATNLAKLTSTEGQQALASAQSKGWNVA